MRSQPIDIQPNQAEMGMSSIVSVLQMAHKDNISGNKLLSNISDYMQEQLSVTSDTFKMFSTKNVSTNSFWKTMRSANTVRNNLLRGLGSQLVGLREQLMLLRQESSAERIKLESTSKMTEIFAGLNLLFNSRKEQPEHVSMEHEPQNLEMGEGSTTIFTQISTNTKNMVSLLQALVKASGAKGPKLAHGPEDHEEHNEEHGEKKIKGFFDIRQFAQSIAVIKTSLTKGLISNISKFEAEFRKLLELPEKKVEVFNKGMDKFAEHAEKTNKSVKPLMYCVGLLALGFGALGLAMVNPMFIAGLGVLGLFVVAMKKWGGDKELAKGTLDFALGIGVLSVAMLMMKFVDWGSMAKLAVFIGAFGMLMKIYSTKAETSGMLDFALGIGVMSIAMFLMNFVNWSSGVKMLLFIGGLGLALKAFGGNNPKGIGGPMLAFGEGIGLLTIALMVMNYVDFVSIFKMLLFIGGLGLVLKVFNFDQSGMKNPILSFALGLGIMVLAVLAFAEVPIAAILKTLAFIGILGLELKLFNGNSTQSPLWQFAFGLGLMVLAMYAMQELPWEALAKTLLFIGGLGLVLKLFSGTSGVDFLMVSAGILVIAGALWIYKKIGWTMKDALTFGGTVTLLGIIVATVGALAEVIVPGSIAMVAMGISLALFALSLFAISKMAIDFEAIGRFGLAALALTVTMALITPLAVVGALGALLFIPIAVSGLLGALSLFAISKLKIDGARVKDFAGGAFDLTWGFVKIAPLAVIGAIGAALFIPIALAAIIGAGALKILSLLKIDNKAVSAFGEGAKSLVAAIDDIGIVSLVRTSAKALLLLPIFGAASLGALLLKTISESNISETKVLAAGKLIGEFTDLMLDTITKNADKLAKAQPGIRALGTLMGISKDIANAISSMSNMEYVEHEVKNGRLVVKSVKKVTPADLKRVGSNLAIILQAMIEPLSIFGSDAATFDIGGRKVLNPFKNPQALKGISFLGKIGQAFKPLFDSIAEYAGLDIAQNPKKLDMFSKSLQVVMNSIIWAIDQAAKVKTDIAQKSLALIARFISSFKDLNLERMTGINSVIEKFMNNLADDAKWRRIISNVQNLRKEFQNISGAINSIDMGKATIFERTLRELLDKQSSTQLSEVVEQLKEIFGLITDNQKGNKQPVAAEADDKKQSQFGFSFGNPTPPAVKAKSPKTSKEAENNDLGDVMNNIGLLLTQIVTQLTGVNDKLAGKLKVQSVGGTANMFGLPG
jgi:hypothetical protein